MTLDDFQIWLEQKQLRAMYIVNEDETRVHTEILEKLPALRATREKELKK